MTATVSADPLAEKLTRIARRWGDDHFDEKMGLVFFYHPNNGHMVGHNAYLLRESAYYAFTLLRSGEEPARRRAARILERILTKQNLDESSPFWACFTCEYEQDWATWEHPDQNWAQFFGLIFAYILQLDRDTACLEPDLREKVSEAFRLNVLATMRRNVRSAYTNIAVLSAAVTAAGDSLLQIEGAEAFSFGKLSEVLARAEPSTTFDEYLSPTYYATDLYALYGAGQFARTERIREKAARLVDLLWDDIDRAYHGPTFQLGGPHSRAYGDNMLEYAAKLKYYLYLALDGDYPLNEAETQHAHDCGPLAIIATHQVERRLSNAPRGEDFERVTLPRPESGAPKVLSQYQDETLSLGTVSVEDNWTQRRNLLAYWRTDPGNAIGVGKGWFVHDRQEIFKEPMFYSAQWKTSVLVGLRVPVAAAPDGAFSYCLDFNAPAGELPPDAASGCRLQAGGLGVEVLPVAIPGATGDGPNLKVTARPDAGMRIEWRWNPPAPGQEYFDGAFAVAFQAGEAARPEIREARATVAGDAVTLTATVDGELLSVTMPRQG